MPASTITPATAFVDWNSQIHAARVPRDATELERAAGVLNHVGRVIGRALTSNWSEVRFDVTLRLYHGWHRGFELTARRKALVQTVAGADFTALSTKATVVIRRDIQFGDNLISASATRLHQRLGCHLPNTLRKAILNPNEMEEKMVDTAIASDLVDLAHRENERWLVLIGEDDDLIPPLYTAEGIRGANGGRVLLIRGRPETPFLKLKDMSYAP